MPNNKPGRPSKVNIDVLIGDIDSYIESADPPIIAEYAHLHGITRQRLYQLADEKKAAGDDRLFDAIKKLSEAKEIKLEKNGLSGDYAANVAIFSLKQLGWSDKQNMNLSVGNNVEDDPLTKSLKEMAKELQSDD
jgi:hypothetical protein